MGKVYKAHDTEIKEKVALKLLKPEIAADEKTIERFRNEIRLARKIVHKNVVRMYDLSKAEGTYFITMRPLTIGTDSIWRRWLEKAYKERNIFIWGFREDMLFGSIRSDPRFKALLKKVNLE